MSNSYPTDDQQSYQRMINKATRRMIIMYPKDDQFKHLLIVTTQSYALGVCKRNVAACLTGNEEQRSITISMQAKKIFKDAGIE